MQQTSVEAEFSEDELEILDEALKTTASSRRYERDVAMKLQTEAGRSLYRTVLAMRDGRRVARRSEMPVVREGSKVASDWPSGKWSEEMGEAAVREFERSGLTEAAFCRATGISRGRIRGWMRRLRAVTK